MSEKRLATYKKFGNKWYYIELSTPFKKEEDIHTLPMEAASIENVFYEIIFELNGVTVDILNIFTVDGNTIIILKNPYNEDDHNLLISQIDYRRIDMRRVISAVSDNADFHTFNIEVLPLKFDYNTLISACTFTQVKNEMKSIFNQRKLLNVKMKYKIYQ